MRIWTTKRSDDVRDYSFPELGNILYGLHYMSQGVFLCLAYIDPERFGNGLPDHIGIFLLGLVIVAASAWFLCSVPGITLDRAEERLHTWRRFLGLPFLEIRVKAYELRGLKAVVTTHHCRGGFPQSMHTYPVQVAWEEGEPLDIYAMQSAAMAYGFGREMARFLEVGLHEGTMGTLFERSVEEVGTSLVERLRRGERKLFMPPAPEGTAMRHSDEGDLHRFALPPGGMRNEHVIACFIGAVVSGFLIYALDPFGRAAASPCLSDAALFLLVNLLCVLIPVVIPIACAVAAKRQGKTVEVDAEGLRCITPWWVFSTTSAIPSAEIEDLEILTKTDTNPAKGFLYAKDAMVMARSPEAMLLFGFGLTMEELSWLKAALEKALAG